LRKLAKITYVFIEKEDLKNEETLGKIQKFYIQHIQKEESLTRAFSFMFAQTRNKFLRLVLSLALL